MLRTGDTGSSGIFRKAWSIIRHPGLFWRASFLRDILLCIHFVFQSFVYIFAQLVPEEQRYWLGHGRKDSSSAFFAPATTNSKRRVKRPSKTTETLSTEQTKPRRALSFESAVQPQPQSLFLTMLPLEIRQEIYGLVMAGRDKHFVRLGFADVEQEKDFELANSPYRTYDTSSLSRFPPPPSFNKKVPAGVTYGKSHSAQHWPTASHLLALPLTSRQTYIEAIDILYKTPTFKVSRLFTLQDLQRSFVPQRFAVIRRLELAYEFRCGLPLVRETAIREDADWARFWEIVACDMPGLRVLRADLFNFDVRSLVVEVYRLGPDGESGAHGEINGDGREELVGFKSDEQKWEWLRQMLRVKGLENCRIKLHHARKLNLVHSALPPVSKYMERVVELLEQLIANAMVESGPSNRSNDEDVEARIRRDILPQLQDRPDQLSTI